MHLWRAYEFKRNVLKEPILKVSVDIITSNPNETKKKRKNNSKTLTKSRASGIVCKLANGQNENESWMKTWSLNGKGRWAQFRMRKAPSEPTIIFAVEFQIEIMHLNKNWKF